MKLLIDADSILFKAACVGKVKGTADQYNDELFDVRQRVDAVINTAIAYCFADETYLAVKGRGNFRYDIYPDYKSHRKVLGDNLRERLNHAHTHALEHWSAVQADKMEADDLVGIWASQAREAEEDYMIAHIDKDLNQLPGNHYNYDKEEHYFVDDSTADWHFCIQLLTGDKADGIPGLQRGLGPKKAERILDGSTYDTRMGIIVDHYRRLYGNGWASRLNLIGNLLWMKRTFSEELEFNYEDRTGTKTDQREQDECLPSSSDEGRKEVRAELSDN